MPKNDPTWDVSFTVIDPVAHTRRVRTYRTQCKYASDARREVLDFLWRHYPDLEIVGRGTVQAYIYGDDEQQGVA